MGEKEEEETFSGGVVGVESERAEEWRNVKDESMRIRDRKV